MVILKQWKKYEIIKSRYNEDNNLNGSPRKNNNTAKMLKLAKEGKKCI